MMVKGWKSRPKWPALPCSRGVGRGGAEGAAAPPHQKKKGREEREGRRRERKKREEREKRNQKRKEGEPVIPRTCLQSPLLTPRSPHSPETPDRNGIGISFLTSAPPFRKILPTPLLLLQNWHSYQNLWTCLKWNSAYFSQARHYIWTATLISVLISVRLNQMSYP